MCEFKVFLDGRKILEDITCAKSGDNKVILRDILGVSREVQGCFISEVDVDSEMLSLSPTAGSQAPRFPGRERGIDEVLTRSQEFHGHLGPFMVLGVRMGLHVRQRLRSDELETLHITAETGFRPPISCIVDGIQVSTACTVGRGCLRVKELGKPAVVFHAGSKRLRLEVKPSVVGSLRKELSGATRGRAEELAKQVNSMSDSELFDES